MENINYDHFVLTESDYLECKSKNLDTDSRQITFFYPNEFDFYESPSSSFLNTPANNNISQNINNTNIKSQLNVASPVISRRNSPLSFRFEKNLGSSLDNGVVSVGIKLDDSRSVHTSMGIAPILPKQDDVYDLNTNIHDKFNDAESNHGSTNNNILIDVLTKLSRSTYPYGGNKQYTDDMRLYWMADETCKECYECGVGFTALRRRHHCRICGQIFCANCCGEFAPGSIFGLNSRQRVCTYCYGVLLNYTQTTTGTADMNAFLRESSFKPAQTILPNLRFNNVPIPLGENSSTKLTTPSILDIDTDTYDANDEESNHIAKDFLLPIWIKMQDMTLGMHLQTQRYRFKLYQNIVTGVQIIDWLIKNRHCSSQQNGEKIGQALIDFSWLIPASKSIQIFKYDNRPYYLTISQHVEHSTGEVEIDNTYPDWIRGIGEENNAVNEQNEVAPTLCPYFEESKDGNSIISRNKSLIFNEYRNLENYQSEIPIVSLSTTGSNPFTRLTKQIDGDYYSSKNVENQINYPMRNSISLINIVKFSLSGNYKNNISKSTLNYFYSDLFRNNGFVRRYQSEPCLSVLSQKNSIANPNAEYNVFDSINCNTLTKKKSFYDFDGYEAYKRIEKYSKYHLSGFLIQELKAAGLSSAWYNILFSVITEITSTVRLNIQHDDEMDIRKYVMIKKIPGGIKSETCIVNGIICTKNITNKHSTKYYQSPRILLLKCAFEFERKENKYSSFGMILMQETEYISNLVAKVLALKPNLIIVEKSVARIAQEMLHLSGITVITNMKPSVMERIARSTNAHQLVSLDQLTWKIKLGTCKQFFLKTHKINETEMKTFMYFDGCPPVLGCTVCLRGANHKDLVKLKKITQLLILSSYNLQLESAFLMDTFSKPQPFPSHLPKYVFDIDYGSPDSEIYRPNNTSNNNRLLNPEDGTKNCLEVNQFEKIFDNYFFTLSPFVLLNAPYFETEQGKNCQLKRYLKNTLYKSLLFTTNSNTSSVLSPTHSNIIGLLSNEYINSKDTTVKLDANKPKSYLNNNLYNKHDTASNVFVDGVRFKPELYMTPSISHYYSNSIVVTVPTRYEMNSFLSDYRANVCYFNNYNISMKIPNYILYKNNTVEKFEDENEIISENSPKYCSLDNLDLLASQQEYTNPIEMNIDKNQTKNNNTNLDSPSHYFNTKNIDCFDLNYHQKLAVLYSSSSETSANWPMSCIKPWVILMDFYGENDICLYRFLMKFCFRPNYICHSGKCREDMDQHIRYFAHGDAALFIRTEVSKAVSSDTNRIMTWGFCIQCEQFTPVSPLSSDAQSYSFAKFLELKFYGKKLVRRLSSLPCNHATYRNQIQYFAYGGKLVAFEYKSIKLQSIILPSTCLTFDARELLFKLDWAKDLKDLSNRISTAYQSFKEKFALLMDLIDDAKGINMHKNLLSIEEAQLSDRVNVLVKDSDNFGCFENQAVTKEVKYNSSDAQCLDMLSSLQDKLAIIKNILSMSVQKWNKTVQSIIDQDNLAKTLNPIDTIHSTTSGNTILNHPRFSTVILEEEIPINSSSNSDNENITSQENNNNNNSDDDDNTEEANIDNNNDNNNNNNNNHNNNNNNNNNNSEYFSYSQKICSPNVTLKRESEPYNVMQYGRQYSEPVSTTSKGKSFPSNFPKDRRISSGYPRNLLIPVSLPFSVQEHYTLENGIIPLAIYENEPSSIIAYSLNCSQYKEKLNYLLKKESNLNSYDTNSNNNNNNNNNSSSNSSLNINSIQNEDSSSNLDSLLNSEEHINLEFEDSYTNFYCKVYFATHFRKLRDIIYSGGEDGFVRSLSRCINWVARGGKTRATFRKVLDDQFIIKQMSRAEVESFLFFANDYFKYITEATLSLKPTVLAKVLGVFRIAFKNTSTSQTIKEDVLVIENLFYKHTCTRTFDLKGSLRNRYISPTYKNNEVLLDENLIEYIGTNPIFLHPHAQKVFFRAVYNDSNFLANHSIMDYSLLVGIKEDTNELVLGIIDFIRTFTWDKKLEMWVKSTGILGGGGKAPTVISPEKYKKRFYEAIDKYFPMVPDKWTMIGLNIN